jgi:hypothetical protein
MGLPLSSPSRHKNVTFGCYIGGHRILSPTEHMNLAIVTRSETDLAALIRPTAR